MADIGSKDCGKRLAVDMEEFFANTYELVVSCKFNVINSRTHYYFFEVCCDKNITLLISLSIFTLNGVIFLSCISYILSYSEQWKKKLSHSILYFPTSFEHRPVFEGGIFKNKKLQKLREFISFVLRQMFDVVTTTILTLSLIHIWRCRRSTLCRSRWSPYH